jgi:endoglucanase
MTILRSFVAAAAIGSGMDVMPFCLRLPAAAARRTASLRTAALSALLVTAACGSPPVPSVPPARTAAPTAKVAHVQGDRLVGPDGKPLVLRGMAFGNRVWLDERIPDTHHSGKDYAYLRELGMNAVRFYLNYRTFENDAAPGQWLSDGFQWLDQNVAWAKQNGVYLVLNLHVPPGGFQSNGGGKALWQDPVMQQRFVALWREIARRYAAEPTIAGFDLLNEPSVPNRIEEWKSLAERAIAAIREVDPNHAIFVERVNAVKLDWSENQDRNFFRVSDPNVVYEFHFYKPFHFTHQNAKWVDFAAENQRYPDPKVAEVEWFLLDYATGTYDSPKLPPGDSDWKYYEGKPFRITDPSLAVGKPSLVCSRAGAGKAYFDEIVLERLDAENKPLEELYRVNLDTTRGWYFWQQSGDGKRDLERQGHGDASSLSITGTTDEANLGADPLRFRPVAGQTYRLSGWMKGERIPAAAVCQVRLDFSRSKLPVQTRGREFLEQEVDAYVAWGKREGVPLFLGEFGAIRHAFEQGRGGERWTEDMLELLLARNLSFTYHDYHEEHFGLFLGEGSLPDPKLENRSLSEVFRRKLAALKP